MLVLPCKLFIPLLIKYTQRLFKFDRGDYKNTSLQFSLSKMKMPVISCFTINRRFMQKDN